MNNFQLTAAIKVCVTPKRCIDLGHWKSKKPELSLPEINPPKPRMSCGGCGGVNFFSFFFYLFFILFWRHSCCLMQPFLRVAGTLFFFQNTTDDRAFFKVYDTHGPFPPSIHWFHQKTRFSLTTSTLNESNTDQKRYPQLLPYAIDWSWPNGNERISYFNPVFIRSEL